MVTRKRRSTAVVAAVMFLGLLAVLPDGVGCWSPSFRTKASHRMRTSESSSAVKPAATSVPTTAPKPNAFVRSLSALGTGLLLTPSAANALANYGNYYQKMYVSQPERSPGSPLELLLFGGVVYAFLKLSKSMEGSESAVAISKPVRVASVPKSAAVAPAPVSSFVAAPAPDVGTEQTVAPTLSAPAAAAPVEQQGGAAAYASNGASYSPQAVADTAYGTDTAPSSTALPAKDDQPKQSINGSADDYMADFIAACKAGSD